MENNIPIEELYSQPVVQELLDKVNSNAQEKEKEVDLENIKIPYVIEGKILMSPGVWNNYYYSNKAIKNAFLKTRWDDKQIRSLFLDHLDQSTKEWIGEVRNPRMKGDNLVGDLVIVDKPTAQKLAYGAKMGISPKVHGEQEDNKMLNFLYDNFSVVINPAVKTAYINNMEVKKMAEEPKVEDAPKQEEPVKVEEEQPKTEEPKEQPEEPVENKETETKENTETEAKMSDTEELLSAIEEVENQGNVGAIIKKAKEIRKEGEAWKDAMKRASSMMAEEEPKEEPKPEEPKPEEPKEEEKENTEEKTEMADADVVNQIIKLAAMLQKKKEYPEPEKDDKEKKYPKAEEEDKMNEHTEKMEETINELSEQVATLTKKLNEPDKVSEKGETAEHTLSEDQKEEYVKQNLDEAFLNMLNNS